MRFYKRVLSGVMAAVTICSLCMNPAAAAEENKEVQILFTHDLHSHLDEFKSGDEMIGGMARLKTAIDEKRQENEATFVLDGGDFSMGTLFQTIFQTQAAELSMLGRLGYDATTFGNHEFDYKPEGVANMFHSAIKNAEEDDSLKLPQFVISNIDWEINYDERDMLVKDALDAYGSTEYTIIERGGVKIGVFGMMGDDAEACAPEGGIDFDYIVDTATEMVKALKAEGAELIVALSHSGTWEDPEKSEDEILAQEVPEIDVIISGHTHTLLEEAIVYGDTIIVSVGDYGRYLGEIDLVQNEKGRWDVVKYAANPMDKDVAEDPAIKAIVEEYKVAIDEEYLSQFGYSANQVIAVNDVEFSQMNEFGRVQEEDTLGNLISDAYMYAVKEAEGDAYEEVALAVTAHGVVRDTFQSGEITVSDAFNVSSLGIGPDGVVGYPLVSVYLTGAELKVAAEIDASVTTLMSGAQLYPSGMRWEYNPNRLILNRVTEVELVTENGVEEIEDNKLYRVIAGLYSAQMLGTVESKSFGILSVTPKDANGEPITDFNQHIVHDQNGNEVKEWYALASYIDSFKENEDGISVMSDRYAEKEGRKVSNDEKGIVEFFKNPNKIARVVYGIVLLLLALIIFIGHIIRKLIIRHKAKKAAK